MHFFPIRYICDNYISIPGRTVNNYMGLHLERLFIKYRDGKTVIFFSHLINTDYNGDGH